MTASLNQTFEPLSRHSPWLLHGLTLRVPGVDTLADRETALSRLSLAHREILTACGVPGARRLVTLSQVHGADVAIVRGGRADKPEADALCSDEPGALIGIYVADCGPLWVVDPARRVIGLAHSGRKGTEHNVAGALIRTMREVFGSREEDLEAFLGPCIRPPHYETDFASVIIEQCRKAGVRAAADSGLNTAADLARYYSYRMERGRTGRMLAWAFIK